ncbi:hypothetical protein BKA57DRAFT_444181 [Linnemannia elongata]|nr:hypothetical protein BKA57DRAFT_444181 [Linnemannia elongata]
MRQYKQCRGTVYFIAIDSSCLSILSSTPFFYSPSFIFFFILSFIIPIIIFVVVVHIATCQQTNPPFFLLYCSI